MKHEDYAIFAVQNTSAVHTEEPFVLEMPFALTKPATTVLALRAFLLAKRVFDVLMSLILLPILMVTMVGLFFANRKWNAGPMFFVQRRMGRDCQPFNAIKLRTMKPVAKIKRSANCPLEKSRITPLGKFLRQLRLDEMPQLLNVLKGDMSIVGPRPDYYEHAEYFLQNVHGYRERHAVRPGISGLAQTEVGYAEGIEATCKKVRADLFYIENRGLRLEAWIVWRTVAVVLGRVGT